MSRFFDRALARLLAGSSITFVVGALFLFVLSPTRLWAAEYGDCKSTSGCTTGCAQYNTLGGTLNWWCNYCCNS